MVRDMKLAISIEAKDKPVMTEVKRSKRSSLRIADMDQAALTNLDLARVHAETAFVYCRTNEVDVFGVPHGVMNAAKAAM